jgi:flagellar biosynthetic protein FlhB
MAEQDQSGEKTEQPSEKRLRDAREKGDIPRSRELATAAVFGAGALAVINMAPGLARDSMGWMTQALSPSASLIRHPERLLGHMGGLMLDLLLMVAPVAVICVIAGFAGPLLLGGLQFSSKSLVPDLGRLSPLKGLKRLYGPESLAELLKSLLRIALVGGAATLCIWLGLDSLRSLMSMPLEAAASRGLGFTGTLLMATAGALLLLAAIDAPYQKWNHTRKLKMTRQEMRDELKESEGRPEVKARVRQLQHQLSQRQMMESVPEADVIVTNPTHYAVALKYDGSKSAPEVIAKGLDHLALRIREVAEEHDVTIVHQPPLARALYRDVELGELIPEELFGAVAEVLAFVFRTAKRRGRRRLNPAAA